jgi:REP element-mobilizing transposase RayT
MPVWNDSDAPLAFLITFRTYGTWLHGDERGSVDRHHNIFGTRVAESRVVREQQQVVKLKSDPFVMNAEARSIVRDTMIEVCAFRNWVLHAQNIRTNHAHAVVAGTSPDKILNDLKAYTTRRLREAGVWTYPHSPWSDKGSKRYLWTDDQVLMACGYVINAQGDDLPVFNADDLSSTKHC